MSLPRESAIRHLIDISQKVSIFMDSRKEIIIPGVDPLIVDQMLAMLREAVFLVTGTHRKD